MGKEKKVIYYSDELNDEFAGDSIKPKKIDGKYKYFRKSFFFKVCHFFWYRIIATPLAYAYLKIKFHHKIDGKKNLRPYKKSGYFLFGNHTHNLADALIPTMITTPKDTYVIVHPNNVSMPVLGKITPYLGALPLPDDFEASKNFVSALEKIVERGNAITIYPEAHIWPFYTHIRPFSDKSFRYPINLDKPVFCFVNTYQKRKRGNGTNIVTYVAGPFFADKNLPAREAKLALRNAVYEQMVEFSKKSNKEIVTYIKKEKNDG